MEKEAHSEQLFFQLFICSPKYLACFCLHWLRIRHRLSADKPETIKRNSLCNS